MSKDFSLPSNNIAVSSANIVIFFSLSTRLIPFISEFLRVRIARISAHIKNMGIMDLPDGLLDTK